jgi:hypothetical protein
MAKKKTQWATVDTDSAYDEVFRQAVEVAKEKYPGCVYSGNAEAMRVVCLPVPAFSVRYLLQQEGWPLGRFCRIVGEQESCKSSIGFEIMRWHGRIPGGGGILIPTEPKDSPELFRSIVGYDHPRMWWHDKCKTVEEWNAAASDWIKNLKKAMDGTAGDPGPGRKAPVCEMVDSLTANLTEAEYKVLFDEGASDRHYAGCAMLLKDFVMYITQEIDDYPFTFLGVNHMKLATEKVGMFTKTIRNIGGGKTMPFFETMQLQMRRKSAPTPGKEIYRAQEDECGIELEIGIYKNSLAPHAVIDVDMLWFTDYDDRDPAGHFRQKTYFDWQTSSIEILADLLKGEGKRARRLREVIDLTVDKDTRKVWSPTLGIQQRAKVKFREAGAILEEKLAASQEFRDALYAETGIRRRYLFKAHMDYRDQIEEAVKLAAKAEVEAEQQQAASPFGAPPEEQPEET